MNRRQFCKIAGLSSAVMATLPPAFNVMAQSADYQGKLLITLQMEGGWDVTQFCDPKINIAGEEKINNWADNGEIQKAGNISYAPVANNQAFFEKYYRDMLVINGIDAQTNSHTAGVIHNWSGRISEGFPSLTALFSAINAPELPISYINNGGYGHTGDLIRYTRMDDVGNLNNIIYPNHLQWDSNYSFMHQSEWDLVTKARMDRLARLNAKTGLSVREKLARAGYQSALTNAGVLTKLAESVASAGELQEWENSPTGGSSLKRQMQLALLAMKSGVSSAADLVLWGFDTHDNHDSQHAWLYGNLTSSIDYLWTYAEQLGIADRIVLVIGSDFGRTPHYNDDDGKDHWPIGSMIVMEQGASWGNRVVGKTDSGHNAMQINPASWAEDAQNGSLIYPKHVMDALRSYLGISQSSVTQTFAFNNAESFNFFK